MLAQYIRCSTANTPELIGNIGVLKVYEELIKCSALIKKMCALGQLRHPGSVSCYKLQLAEPQNGNQMFSDDAVAAARSAIVDDDCFPLSRIFNESMMRTLRKEFCGISMPSDSDMDAVRMMLNMNYGGDFKLSGDM